MKRFIIALIALSCAVATHAADYTPVIVESSQLIQSVSVTAVGTTETNTFATAYSVAPVVTISYTEDCGDVQPCYVSSVTTSNFICVVTSSKNYAYVAVGAR